MQQEKANPVLIGSYTDGKKKPSVYLFNSSQQTANPVVSTINPSFILTTDRYIHLVSEQKKGELITLDLSFQAILVVETNGSDPCHISKDEQHRFVVVTNYSSGSFTVFLCDNQGLPSKGKFFIQHEGSSTDPDRQQSPHPHSSVFSWDGKVLFVADLGTDILYWYDISEKDIEMNKQKSIKMVGAGPRTLCRGPKNQNVLFLTCELDSTIRVLTHSQEGGLNCISAYKTSSNPQNYLSQVYYEDGQVYLTARGDDFMMVFNYIHEKHSLAQRFRFKVGAWPRHFLKDGRYIYIACQKEGKVYMFTKDDDKIMQLLILQIADCVCVARYKQ